MDDPGTYCPLKSKKKQCKIYENCAWRNKGQKCTVSPKLARSLQCRRTTNIHSLSNLFKLTSKI